MNKAKNIINEIKASQLKKGTKVTFKKDNFRFKGQEGVVISVDDPKTGDEDILVMVTVNNKKEEVSLGELA